MRQFFVIAFFSVLAGGCLFEPECVTYETCFSEDAGMVEDSGSQSVLDASTQRDSDADDGSTVVVNNEVCILGQCPDTDVLAVAGTREFPATCGSSGDTDFVQFEERASVCVGRQRVYEVWLRPCSRSPFIFEVRLTPTNGCVDFAQLDVTFDDRSCGEQDVRCEVANGTAVRGYIVRQRDFDQREARIVVGATAGGFDYDIVIETRR